MLKVTIDLLPFGSKLGREEVGLIEIVNDGSGNEHVGNYNVKLFKRLNGKKGREVWRQGRVEGFERKARGPYDLLRLALAAVLKDR